MQSATNIVRREVLAIAPYNAGITISEVVERFSPPVIAKLGSNESPLGPSPLAHHAIRLSLDMIRLYPDPQGRLVRAKLAEHYKVGAGRIILGNGSEDLLSIIARGVLRPDDRVLTLYPSFPLHEDYTTLMGGKVQRIALGENFSINVDSLIEALSMRPRMLLFSNPMNPVGVMLKTVELAKIIVAVPPETLIVIDEAYGEYIIGDGYASALEILTESRCSWIVLKTFSKAYGLAGLRLGYGIASDAELISLLDRVRTPFNVNSLAQVAAQAALTDNEHLMKVTCLAQLECVRISQFLLSMGCKPAPTQANFVFFDCKKNASEVSEQLLRHGVIVKPWKQTGYETYIRVSAGTRAENDQFMSALSTVLGKK